MKAMIRQIMGPAMNSSRGSMRTWMLVVAALALAGVLTAQEADSEDVEQTFRFIERTAQATDLFNIGKAEEALSIFQDLVQNSPAGLDEDGLAAMGLADCLTVLGRHEEARLAYGAAEAAHPALASSIADRVAELDIMVLSDDALARMRLAAVSARPADQWRLARALQKKAQVLLDEAAKSFRATAAADSIEFLPKPASLSAHAAVLEELNRDLSSLIDQTETFWGALRGLPRRMSEDRGGNPAGTGLATERRKLECLVRTRDGQRLEVQLRGETSCDPVQITINGKPVELTETERRLIERHQDRINAILIEASGRTGGK